MESNNSIYQWLSTVEDHQQGGQRDEGVLLSHELRSFSTNRALAENQEQVKDTALATNIPRIRIPLEISESVRGNGHLASRKRNSGHLDEIRASPTHETIPGNESHKRSRYSYELRPRHKTREDRYEYKGPSSAVEAQSQSRKRKAKKPRGRRPTMNDEFHAINVTGNRLTLRSNTNLGIFSKGRSSSITNHHGNTPTTALTKATPSIKPHKYVAESDLAFSEMNFLSRRNNPSPYPTSTARDTLDGQHEREYHPQEQQFNDPAHSKLDTSHSNNKVLDLQRQLDSSVTPLFTFEEAHVSELSKVSSHSRGVSTETRNKRRKISKDSSSIPYTWDETEVDNTEESHVLEQHLLNLLHVGVFTQVLCSKITSTVSARRYWSLAELWGLLEERKASWSNEAVNKKRASLEANTEQLAAVEAEADIQEVPEIIAPDHVDLANVGSVQNKISKQSPDLNIACEAVGSESNNLPQPHSVFEQEQDGPCQVSDIPGCLSLQATKTSESQDRYIDILNEDQCEPLPQESTEDEVLFPASVPEVEHPHISDIEFYALDRVDDDDAFYRTLDAAYCAIVRPGVAAEVASDLQQLLESPELNATDLPNSPESTGVRDSDIPPPASRARAFDVPCHTRTI
ncbi:hypothetical protein N7445_009734 [Penicillium cf. griseofulvum]|nr:hypothetical protein N7445_009734 [Penicillium cf. griseofulvum]